MARRIVETVQEVQEVEVEVEETEKTAENTYVLSQKTKYNADDEKAYAFDVILDFTDVEIQELYKFSAKSLVIAIRPQWKEDKVLEEFEKAGKVRFPVRQFLDRERSRGPSIITAEALAKQMEIPLETAEMVLQAMRDNPQTLQEQISAMVGKTAK
jgi:hypothetical protein